MRSKTASREPSSAPTSRPSGSPSMSASEEPIGGPSVSQSAVPSETHSKSSSTSESSSDDTTAYNSVSGGSDEITMFPKLLDSKLEKYDSDGALRSTIIKVGNDWFRKRQENLLTPSRTKRLDEETIDEGKKNALDLLDAISRSGSLSLATSELHVIIGVTHSLDESAISFFFFNAFSTVMFPQVQHLRLLRCQARVQRLPRLRHQLNFRRLHQLFPLINVCTDFCSNEWSNESTASCGVLLSIKFAEYQCNCCAN